LVLACERKQEVTNVLRVYIMNKEKNKWTSVNVEVAVSRTGGKILAFKILQMSL
jgi:hypothetical protein